MTPIRKMAVAAAIVAASFAGGAVGSVLINGSANAASTTAPSGPSASTGAPGNATPDGRFHSNEDPAHEKGESAAREAQENAGQRPTVP